MKYSYYKYMIVDPDCNDIVIGFCNRPEAHDFISIEAISDKVLNPNKKSMTKRQLRNLIKKRRLQHPTYRVS